MSLTRTVAKAVVLNARDVAEARVLLDMLGLLDGPGGRELVELNAQPVSLPEVGTSPGARSQGATTPVERRPEGCTTPPGLRDLPPLPVAAPAKPARKPRTLTGELEELERTDPAVAAASASYDAMVQRVTSNRAPAAAPRGPRANAAQCGTTGGLRAHLRRGEPTCEACRAAERERHKQRAESRAKAAGREPGRRPRPACGTNGGYRAHRVRDEDACQPCKSAAAAYQRERAAARRTTTPDTATA